MLFRAGPGYHAGTVGVSGLETGWGGSAETVWYKQSDGAGFGLGIMVEVAGYSTDGDADPIAFNSLEVRYRRPPESRDDTGRYWEVGTGLGLAWVPSIQRVVIPLQAEVGLQKRFGGSLVSVGLRERLLPMVGSGSPPFDIFNSLQLVVGVGTGVRIPWW